ncbi:hypothetical protein BC830DRAFT_1131126 [Chytriomyces sp. MP71]|nr:hypothetical protein BC830DRAFT_1131126 [Chytriomyces sp. MP71]
MNIFNMAFCHLAHLLANLMYCPACSSVTSRVMQSSPERVEMVLIDWIIRIEQNVLFIFFYFFLFHPLRPSLITP